METHTDFSEELLNKNCTGFIQKSLKTTSDRWAKEEAGRTPIRNQVITTKAGSLSKGTDTGRNLTRKGIVSGRTSVIFYPKQQEGDQFIRSLPPKKL